MVGCSSQYFFNYAVKTVNGFLVSKETVVLRRWERCQWQSSSTLTYKPQHPTIPLFALRRAKRSKRQLSKSFTVVIQPLSTRLIKPNLKRLVC